MQKVLRIKIFTVFLFYPFSFSFTDLALNWFEWMKETQKTAPNENDRPSGAGFQWMGETPRTIPSENDRSSEAGFQWMGESQNTVSNTNDRSSGVRFDDTCEVNVLECNPDIKLEVVDSDNYDD